MRSTSSEKRLITSYALDNDVPPLKTRCCACGPVNRWCKGPDDPHVLLEQVQGAARTLCCDEQRLALVLARQLQELRHEAPAR
jgi:hypothetical protein